MSGIRGEPDGAAGTDRPGTRWPRFARWAAASNTGRPRLALVALTALIGAFIAWEAADLWTYYASRNEVGQDWSFYTWLGRRWLDSGVLYGERQLSGLPYHVLVNVDNLYPPPAILLFAPFALVPQVASAILWWGIPIALIGAAIWRLRPAAWTWPLIALCVFWPRTLGSLIVGNSDLLSAGMVAGGILWGWPGALGLFKPSFAPFALAGARRRSWWVSLGVVAVASVPFLAAGAVGTGAILGGAWGQYVTAALHWDLPWDRAAFNTPLLLIPVVAWVGRRDRSLSSTRTGDGTR